MATPPDFTAGAILNAAQMNSIGLWRVTTCTVTSAGGTPATASNGVVTIGTGNTSITVSNAFSADFTRYRILIEGGSSSTIQDLRLQLGSTVSGYYGFIIYCAYSSNAVNGLAVNNGASFPYIGCGSTNTMFADCELSSPFETKRTVCVSRNAVPDTTSSANWFNAFLNDNTSYSSFTITPNTGTMSGAKLYVYGYRE